jgi:hypothetical protein
MIKCLIALFTFFPAAVLAATIWTWVDAEGQRHYSDQPVAGATKVEVAGSSRGLQPVAPAASRPPAEPAQANAAAPPPAATVSYSVLDIVSPENEETFWNIGGVLSVQLATFPALAPNHRIDAILDGNYIQLGARSLDLTIPDVYRGEHTLQLVIVDAEGKELKRSDPVTFYVHQTSVSD